jgi:hypothetical protein
MSVTTRGRLAISPAGAGSAMTNSRIAAAEFIIRESK